MIRVAIIGYGNLGRGVELAVPQAKDMALTGVFTRREPGSIGASSPVYPVSALPDFADQIDVCLLCGSSTNDLMEQAPMAARLFHTVDAFDNHARAGEYVALVDAAARSGGHTAIVCSGWDPGLFSLNRVLMDAVLPQGGTQTFWGRGVSQGHSAAVRELPGVQDAVQYTIPKPDAVDLARRGEGGRLTARDKHRRLCYVVAKEGADEEEITRRIVTMRHYFDEYDTTVVFVSQQELNLRHKAMPHAGQVIRTSATAPGRAQNMEFSLTLDSNPEFTASVMVAYARAAMRLAEKGVSGAQTVLDVPVALLSPLSREELINRLL